MKNVYTAVWDELLQFLLFWLHAENANSTLSQTRQVYDIRMASSRVCEEQDDGISVHPHTIIYFSSEFIHVKIRPDGTQEEATKTVHSAQVVCQPFGKHFPSFSGSFRYMQNKFSHENPL
jgi:hypothetical protein